jgi:hypothetical protein
VMLSIAQRRGVRAVRSTQSLWHVVARDDDVSEAGGMTSHASAGKKRSFGAQARAASAYYGGGGIDQLGFVRVREGDAKVACGAGVATQKFIRVWEEERG